LLDQVGLPDLTMRRLALELDVQPSALYWHYANKQTLLAEVSNAIVAFTRPAGAADNWQQKVLREALNLRDALLAFRDGAEVVSSTLALGLGASDAVSRIEKSIALTDSKLVKAAAESIVFLVLGSVWHEQQRMQANSLGVADNLLDEINAPARNLEVGLELIIAGLNEAKVKA